MARMTEARMQEVRNAFRVLGSLTDEELKFFSRVICMTKENNHNITQPKERTYEGVTEIIHKIGIPAHIKGYDYIRSAVIYLMKAKKTSDVSLTKELYPTIAKEFGTTASRVERATRHGFEVAFKKGNLKLIEEIFGTTTRVSNGEALAAMAEYLKRY